MGAALGFIWAIVLLLYGLSQFAIAFLGFEYYAGAMLAGVAIAACFFFQFTLPITIASFIGAYVVLGWPWYGALLFAAPGLAFMFGFAALRGGAALFSRDRMASR